jgi:carbon-monoxide dehydrogenase large subunit
MSDRISHTYIGRSVTRIEDERFLTGRGAYIDDVKLPGMAAMAILRSPHAHARIQRIDLTAVRAFPGVIDAFSAADLDRDLPRIPLRLAPFKGFERFLQRPIAADKVRYVGEPLAVVVAENRYVAEDALDLAEIDFEPLPAIVALDQAAAGETLVHDEARENFGTRYSVGRGDIDAAFAAAAYTRKERFKTNRHAACPLETRGLIAEFDASEPRLRLHGATKVTFFNRRHLAVAFDLPESAVELIETDVGGGFGARGELYPEDYLVPIAARRAGRPVKWIEDRRENLMAANHSREIDCELEIAATEDGRILGLRAKVRGDMGAYVRTNGGVVPSKAAQFLPGPYRIPAFACDVEFLITNKTPIGTFRGPGRFEANFCRERLLELMAADLGIDRAELRLRNLMQPSDLPFRIGELVPGDPNATLDDGDYPAAFRRLLAEADYDGWKDRQGEIADGRAHGLGLACFIESSAAGPPETARITPFPDGTVEIRTGASSVGQGMETGMAQICAEYLEIPMDGIRVLHGSTTLLPTGGGTFHSRNTVMAGNAVRIAAETLRARCVELAALRWNAAPETLEWRDGGVRRTADSGGERLSLGEIAAFAATREESDGALSADGTYENKGLVSYSYGAHAALVAVDLATGIVEVKRYVLTEEIGRALNPAMVQGQAIGGLIQGLGGTFLDHMIYDEDGQLLTGSFADYLLPTSLETPEVKAIALEDSPSKLNPMGFKGAGEGGIVAVAGAVANAVAAALAPWNVPVNDLPLTPDRIRGALRAAGVGALEFAARKD